MRFPHKAERMSLPHRKVVSLGKLDMMNYNNNAGIPVGFRFHPTDEELVGCYLYSRIARPPPPPLEPLEEDLRIIRELDLYRHEPWDLSEVCKIPGDHSANQNNWYFFSHKDKKYPTGNRANRATKAGFWKATGRDKCIQARGAVGMRKTLVFYRGRAPHGQKTDWIMHEFRLDVDANQLLLPHFPSSCTSSGYDHEDPGAWVVCRVFRKTKNMKSKDDNSNDTPTTSVEEDHQMALLPEITDSTEKFSSDEGEHVDYPPADHMQQQQHFHTDYNSHVQQQQPCKQELLSVNDYAVEHHSAVLAFEGTPASPSSMIFRTSSRCTGTNPNYNTFLDPPASLLFEPHMLEPMPYCCSSTSSSAPSSSSAAGLLAPSPNQIPYLAMVAEENLLRTDSRGLSSYRSSPAGLDALGGFRSENAGVPLLDQSRADVLTDSLERQQQQQLEHAQELLRFTASHDMVPFGTGWVPRSNAGISQFGDFGLSSELNTSFLSSGDHQH